MELEEVKSAENSAKRTRSSAPRRNSSRIVKVGMC